MANTLPPACKTRRDGYVMSYVILQCRGANSDKGRWHTRDLRPDALGSLGRGCVWYVCDFDKRHRTCCRNKSELCKPNPPNPCLLPSPPTLQAAPKQGGWISRSPLHPNNALDVSSPPPPSKATGGGMSPEARARMAANRC